MTNEEFYQEYLSRFSYEDTDGLEKSDLNLRIGDYLLIMYEDSYTGDQHYIHARIIIDEYNSMPCFIINEELDQLDNSGDIQGIYETFISQGSLIKVSQEIWEDEAKNPSS